jgi:Rrf2 family protein
MDRWSRIDGRTSRVGRQAVLGLTKKTDYALLALSHLSRADGEHAVRTREIAEQFGIPPELLAKIMQRLARSGIVASAPGPTGGYLLARSPRRISVGQVIEAVEGAPALAHCMKSELPDCDQHTTCTIRKPLERINARVFQMLSRVSLEEICSGDAREDAGFVALSSIGAEPARMPKHSLANNAGRGRQ